MFRFIFLTWALTLTLNTLSEAKRFPSQLSVAIKADSSIESDSALDKKHHRGCLPLEVHLAITESTDCYRISWKTDSDGCDSSVRYGLTRDGGTSGRSSQIASGRSFSITNKDMCGGKAKESSFSFHMHTALLEGLKPESEYEYLIAGETGKDSSRLFISGPSGPKDSISFIAYGDMGAQGKKILMAAATIETAREEHRRSPLDFVLHVGDISYGDGRPKEWEAFMSQIEPVAQTVPYMVAVGNHDYGYDPSDSPSNDLSGANGPYRPTWGNYGSESRGECGAMTAAQFLMPSSSSYPSLLSTRLRDRNEDGSILVSGSTDTASAANRRLLAGSVIGPGKGMGVGMNQSLTPGPASNPPFWYSFEFGAIHVTTLSSEHDLSPGSMQYRWLQADLANVDRCSTPWLMVMSHRPLYVVYPHKSNRDVGAHLRDSLEDLLIEYRVDMVVSGHVHSYYRSCSVNQEVCSDDQTGVVHFVIGTGGHPLSDVEDQQRLWVSAAAIDNGLGRFDIVGDRLDFVFIRSEDKQVVDRHRQWAQVPREDCRAFMGSRRLAGVERSMGFVARRIGGNSSDVRSLHLIAGLGEERKGKSFDDAGPGDK